MPEQPKRVVIDGNEFVVEVPPGRKNGQGPSLKKFVDDTLAAMDQLGVDCVRVGIGQRNTLPTNLNQRAQLGSVPLRFFGRNTRTENGRQVADIYAERMS